MPPRRPLLENSFFKKKDFTYSLNRETASERGNTSRGVGEEEAGSQRMSPMRDSFPDCQEHALSRRQAFNDCTTQVPLDVGFLIFQPAFWGRGLPHRYSGNPVWVKSPCSLRGGDGDAHTVSRYFQVFVLWHLSLVVCCASSDRAAAAESRPLSQNRGIAARSPLMFWPL